MIIIVEGIDRVGKTTLCEMIEEHYKESLNIKRFRDNTRYAHNHNDMMVNTEKNNTIVSMIEEDIIHNIILDRFHITEFVYGAVDRSYKNFDMYDIDRRLADIGKPKEEIKEPEETEALCEAEEPEVPSETEDLVEKQNDVVLVYVVPVDIKKSSSEHGYNLERHKLWFDSFYNNTMIENKIKVDYESFPEVLEFIDGILGVGEETGDGEVEGEAGDEAKEGEVEEKEKAES